MQSFLNLLSVVGSVFALSLVSADPCESQPCLNNSTCFASEGETWSYNCTCSPGFTGQHCQDRIDNCASNPCAHGNCTSHARGYDCACEPGYRGEDCDQPAGLQTPAPSWTESTQPWQPSPAITSPQPNATTTAPSWQPAVPTLAPWQPEPGHRVVNLTWDVKEMNNSLNLICMNRNLNTSFNSQTPSLEIPEKTSLKIALSGDSAALEFWNVSEVEFQRCSLAHGKNVVPLQTAEGFVLTEETLSLGKNYFIALVNDSLRGSVTALRLSVLVKPNNCEDQEKDGVVHECSGMGQCITKPNMATFYCECEEGHIGHFCEEFDACHSNQCQNNATCLDIQQGNNERNFTCVCAPGYTGEVCQSQVDHCVSQPCHNAATCMSRATGYSCLCPEGFTGPECGEKVDPCASLPCQNNGTCFPDGTSYSCSCSPAYTGPTCAQLIDFCALSPCAHGICRSVGTSYKCLCIPGYHGLYCEEEYNECLSAPCQNSGTCKDLVNAYECLCPTEYEGQHCDFYKDPCANSSCQNGGTCANEGLNATCICAPGFAGETCEIDLNECESNPCHHGATCLNQANGYVCHCPHGWVGANCDIHMEWKSGRMAESLNNMPRHSLYIIIGALCVAFVLMLIILIVGICRISRIEYQGASRPAYEEFYNCRSIDSELSHSIASIRHARFGKKVRPAMYDATPVAYEDYSPDDKPLVTLIKTKDL